jgi:hypothetical protein
MIGAKTRLNRKAWVVALSATDLGPMRLGRGLMKMATKVGHAYQDYLGGFNWSSQRL